ncbi:MAG: hypothetical protein AB1439_08315 [candidate division FCPU426 bacterium]
MWDKITAAFSTSLISTWIEKVRSAAGRSLLLKWWAGGLGLTGLLASWSAGLTSTYLLDRLRRSSIFALALGRPLFVFGLGMSAAMIINTLCNLWLRGWIPFWELKTILSGFGLWLAWFEQRREGAVDDRSAAVVLALFAGFIGMLMFSGRYNSLAALAVLGWLVVLTWHKPQLGLWLFLLLLPVHHLMMTFLTEQVGLSPMADKLIRAWKDILLVVLAAKAGWLWFSGQAKPRLGWTDFLLAVFVVFNFAAFYQARGSAVPHAALYSLRYNVYFIVCFYLGRMFSLSSDQIKRFFLAMLALGIAACLAGALEKGFVLTDIWLHLGYTDYIKHSFNSVFPTPNGLPFTFWLEGYIVRRLGSFFLGPIDFAYAMILIIPVTVYWCAQARNAKQSTLRILVFSFLMSVFLLAFTRAAIFGAGVELLLLTWFLHHRHLHLGWRLIWLTAALALIIFATNELSQWIFGTATFQEASAQGHLGEWKKSVDIIQQQMTGTGLGSAGFIGKRFQGTVGGENQYLILGREIGLMGMGLFIFLHGIVLAALARVIMQNKNEIVQWVAVIALAALSSIVILGMTSQVYINYFLVFITWWLIGWVFQNNADLRAPSETKEFQAL